MVDMVSAVETIRRDDHLGLRRERVDEDEFRVYRTQNTATRACAFGIHERMDDLVNVDGCGDDFDLAFH